MAKVNKSQAARLADVSRTTIDNYIADGKLTAEVDGKKTWIDVSELERVFGKLVSPDTVKTGHQSLQTDAAQLAAIFQSHIERLERQLDATLQEREREREEHRVEKDRLLRIIENQTHLLPKPQEPEPKSQPKKSWWRWTIL
jgi:molybdenum-dependent DNA-binding transcriptional regulator ModE